MTISHQVSRSSTRFVLKNIVALKFHLVEYTKKIGYFLRNLLENILYYMIVKVIPRDA